MTKRSSVEATVGNLSPIHSYPAARTAVGLPIKKFIQNHEIADGESISSWIESMKASSPTNVQGPPPPSIRDKHPSALSMFEEIINLFKGKKMVMFLDYDGTLSPIVDDPDRAFMSKAMRAAVRDVAKFFPTAIVSGRCRDKVYRFVRLAELYYAGSHGMDIKCPQLNKGDKPVLFQPASEFLPMIDEISKLLIEKTSDIPGSTVENNRFCVSVHFRCVEEERWVELATQVRSVLHDFPKLRLNHGRKVNSGGRKRRSLSIFYEIISEGEADEFFGFSSLAKVLEIRPIIEWDKGKALEFMLESLGLADSEDVLPVYIGDDLTDEDAFKVLRERGQGLGILVSKLPKKSHASYSLQEPSEVMSFLHRLVEWKRISGKGHPRV